VTGHGAIVVIPRVAVVAAPTPLALRFLRWPRESIVETEAFDGRGDKTSWVLVQAYFYCAAIAHVATMAGWDLWKNRWVCSGAGG
jgi:hypothetical protein